MSYASVLIHLDIDGGNEGRLEFAFTLAERLNALLIGVGACAFEPLIQPNGILDIADVTVQTEREIRAKLSEQGRAFLASASSRKVKAEWRQSLELPVEAIAAFSRSADLIISRPNAGPWDPFRNPDIADLILRVGRPVVVFPPDRPPQLPKKALVAWKDTREARRALADAIPLLALAEDVLVASIWEGKGSSPQRLEDIGAHLARHGVKARIETFDAMLEDTGDRLFQIADENRIDLIVAGAYGHSRFREWVFGGVTRTLLRSDPAPLSLLSN